MKLMTATPVVNNAQRADTGKWVSCGSIWVFDDHNKDFSYVSEVRTGAEFDQKADAVRDFQDRARIATQDLAAQIARSF